MGEFSHQSARLIAITQPVYGAFTDPAHGGKISMSAEDLIAYCARVSNPSNQLNFSTADKLLRYMSRSKHWSPFEMVNLVIEIQTTRDIARQLLRHRSFAFQEFSQRYAAVKSPLIRRQARIQDKVNRQNSIETNEPSIHIQWKEIQQDVERVVNKAYTDALALGIAKEQARAVLPEGMTQSVLYANGTVRSWIHYCLLRKANGTQLEHQDIANKCWDIIVEQLPSLVNIDNQQN